VGNHDIQDGRRHRVEKDGLIAHEGLVLRHSRNRQQIFVVHGHQVDFKSDRLYAMGRLVARHVWRRLQLLGVGSGPSRAHDTRNRGMIQRRIIAWLQANRQIVICGHTHRPMCAAYGAPPYFNTGSCVYSGYITGLEIRDGEITLVMWSAKPGMRHREALRIERQLLARPRRLRLFGQVAG